MGRRSTSTDEYIRPALEEVRVRTELRPADLADLLDPQSRVVLCRRLVREGLLTVAR